MRITSNDSQTDKAKLNNIEMQSVTLNLFGSIRYAAGVKEIALEFPSGRTVYELLQLAADIYGKDFEGEVFLPDLIGLRDDLTIVVNGIITEHSKVQSCKIEDKTIITLMPVFAGGG